MDTEIQTQDGAHDEGAVRSMKCSASLTLTIEEIRHLALFCGMVIERPTEKEKEDERETEITIAPWPEKGVKGDDGMLPPHKHIAYYDEYPEEGCVPLGSPNDQAQAQPPTVTPERKGRWDMVDGEAREWWLIAREEIEGSEWSFPAGKWLVGFKDLRDGDWCVYPQGQYDGRIFGVPESLLKIVRPVKRPNPELRHARTEL